MPSLKQTSFSSGIVSPQLLGETDQQKYVRSVRECTNAMVQRFGGIQNRSGTQYDDDMTSLGVSTTMRMKKFVFNYANAYELVFSHLRMRPYKNNARISVAGAAAYSGATTYAIGDLVTYSGVVYWSKTSTNIGNIPSSSPAQWYVQAGGYLEIVTAIPYTAISEMCVANLNDIMTITHQSIYPQVLTRYSDTHWTIGNMVTGSGIGLVSTLAVVAGTPYATFAGPANVAAAGGNVVIAKDKYVVTAVGAFNTESGPSLVATSAVGGADGANPVTITWSASVGNPPFYVVGSYRVYKLTAGLFKLLAVVVSPTLTFIDDASVTPGVVLQINSSPSIAFVYAVTAISDTTGSEGLISTPGVLVLGAAATVSAPNVLTFTSIAGATTYNVYRAISGVYSYIGSVYGSGALEFDDIGYTPLSNIQPPTALPLFTTTNDYPSVCAYFQQRLLLAGTINLPTTVTASQIGNYTNFNVTLPLIDSSAFQFTIAGKETQPIVALVDLGKLIIHTASAEYMASGNVYGTITPTAPNVVQQGSFGSKLLPPITIGNTDIFIQTRGSQARDLKYDIQNYGYTGKDLSIFASSLFDGRQIIDMDWQQIPDSIVWMVLDNGVLAGLTYVREHDIWAWHQHSFTNGFVEAVSVVPTGTRDVVSLIIRRTINGATVRYLEHLAVREYLDVVLLSDAVFCDASLMYDGRNKGSTTMTAALNGGGWAPTDTIQLTASGATFTAGDVGDIIVFQKFDTVTGLVTDQIGLVIVTYQSSTMVVAVPQGTVPVWAQATALTTWGKAVKSFSGIGHLNGQSISVLADGNVVASPLNVLPNGSPQYPAIIPSAGTFTLPSPGMVVVAGLPMQMDVQTMPVENAQGETIADKTVNVRQCCPVFYHSRGGLYGQDRYHLREWKQPRSQPPAPITQGFPVQPWTGPVIIPIQGTPQITGQLWIRQVDPLPFAMSGIIVTGDVGK